MNKNGMAKNWDNVMRGVSAMLDEWREATTKVREAYIKRDWRDMAHHFSDYRGACQEHCWKLWFYAFWPRRIVELIVLFLVYRAGQA